MYTMETKGIELSFLSLARFLKAAKATAWPGRAFNLAIHWIADRGDVVDPRVTRATPRAAYWSRSVRIVRGSL